MPERLILLGVIGRPHGVRGLLHVHSYTADPRDLAAYGPLVDDRGQRWSLTWRGAGVAVLQDADGRTITDRAAAERLTNRKLFIERDRLPPPDEDEFYLADLVGLAAVDADGRPIGRVAVVHDYGAGTSLEIERAGPALLVPFTRAFVPEVDVAAGRVVVCPPDELEVPPEVMVDPAAEARA